MTIRWSWWNFVINLWPFVGFSEGRGVQWVLMARRNPMMQFWVFVFEEPTWINWNHTMWLVYHVKNLRVRKTRDNPGNCLEPLWELSVTFLFSIREVYCNVFPSPSISPLSQRFLLKWMRTVEREKREKNQISKIGFPGNSFSRDIMRIPTQRSSPPPSCPRRLKTGPHFFSSGSFLQPPVYICQLSKSLPHPSLPPHYPIFRKSPLIAIIFFRFRSLSFSLSHGRDTTREEKDLPPWTLAALLLGLWIWDTDTDLTGSPAGTEKQVLPHQKKKNRNPSVVRKFG